MLKYFQFLKSLHTYRFFLPGKLHGYRYRNQTEKGVLVLNAKDAHTPAFAAEAKGEVRVFSSKGPVENGAHMQYEILCRADHGASEA